MPHIYPIIDPNLKPVPDEQETLTDDQRIDEAIRESFPASDPPSWSLGVEKHHEPEDPTSSSPDQ